MTTKKIIGIILILIGVVLAYYGYDQKNSIGSQLSSAFGQTNTTAIIYMVGGVILAVAGIVLILKKK